VENKIVATEVKMMKDLESVRSLPSSASGLSSVGAAVNLSRTETTRSARVAEISHYPGKRRGINVKHTEPLGPVAGSTTYAAGVSSALVNPANAVLFPWLSKLAPAFDMYLFNRLKLEYRPTSATNLSGVVGMNFDYEVGDPIPTTRQLFETQQGTKVGQIWEKLACHMYAPACRHNGFYFISNGPAAGGDTRITNQCQLQWYVDGCASNAPVGELWITYDVDMFESTVYGNNSVVNGTPGVFVAEINPGAASALLASLINNGRVPGASSQYGVADTGPSGGSTGTTMNLMLVLPYTQNPNNTITAVQGTYSVTFVLLMDATAGTVGAVNSSLSGPNSGIAFHTTNWNGWNRSSVFSSYQTIGGTITWVYTARVNVLTPFIQQANGALSGYPGLFLQMVAANTNMFRACKLVVECMGNVGNIGITRMSLDEAGKAYQADIAGIRAFDGVRQASKLSLLPQVFDPSAVDLQSLKGDSPPKKDNKREADDEKQSPSPTLAPVSKGTSGFYGDAIFVSRRVSATEDEHRIPRTGQG
jgi:hypothetical protein